MIDYQNYIFKLIDLLRQQFGMRLLYIGLQGSYLRGEATNNSDIDIMVIIDELSVTDLEQYRSAIHSLEHAEKSCGFICSKSDLANWNPLEICHLLHTTQDYFGVLSEFVPHYTKNDIVNFVKVSVANLYHEICHKYIHADKSKNIESLPASYKGVFFILQNCYYLEHNQYIATKAELISRLTGKNYAVLKHAIDINVGNTYDFSESFDLLFTWCQETLKSITLI